jgi:hypothetical protein
VAMQIRRSRQVHTHVDQNKLTPMSGLEQVRGQHGHTGEAP